MRKFAKEVKVIEVRCEACGRKMNADFLLRHKVGCPNFGTGKTTKPAQGK